MTKKHNILIDIISLIIFGIMHCIIALSVAIGCACFMIMGFTIHGYCVISENIENYLTNTRKK